ncbi:hypothetical protein H0H87_012827 [Tephrocybe sp. NHM501043]|nr:hypothetical protein H0H87_012827 [Tephrocybe sp. NHM501043]
MQPDDAARPPALTPPRPFFLGPRTRRSMSSDAPPSSFAYPFQAYAGNPDPLPTRRRVSLESISHYASDSTLPRVGSLSDLHKPQPPFAAHEHSPSLSSSPSSSSLYRASAAAPIAHASPTPAQVFRPPFLSPASRPISTLSWAPPALDYTANASSTALHLHHHPSNPAFPFSTSASTVALAQHRPPLPSTMLEKPSATYSQASLYNDKRSPMFVVHRHRPSWWLTFACIMLGLVGAAAICFFGVNNVKSTMLDENQLCLVMQDDFSGPDLNDQFWTRDVQVDDRGFQVTTSSPKNLYLQNGQLYILPTLMRDENPQYDQDGQSYDVEGCTASVPAPAPVPDPQPSTNTTNGNDNGNGNGGTATTTAVRGGGTQAAAGGNGNGNGRGNARTRRQNTNDGGNGDTTTTTDTGNGNTTTTDTGNTTTSDTGNTTTTNSTNTPAAAPAGTLCRAITNAAAGTVVNPVLSGRITTRGKVGMKYGRVEVVAKVARGDWLWPAVWMLPENDTYGAWPLSGEIDILKTRGNAPSYPAQGSNYVRSALEYGLDKTLTPIEVPGAGQPLPLTNDLFGWFALKRTSFDRAFHKYTLEWDDKYVRFWVDGRVRSVLEVSIDQGKNNNNNNNANANADPKTANGKKKKRGGTFWEKGKFPATAQNKTTGAVVVVQDPWAGGGPAAPFDQRQLLPEHRPGSGRSDGVVPRRPGRETVGKNCLPAGAFPNPSSPPPLLSFITIPFHFIPSGACLTSARTLVRVRDRLPTYLFPPLSLYSICSALGYSN